MTRVAIVKSLKQERGLQTSMQGSSPCSEILRLGGCGSIGLLGTSLGRSRISDNSKPKISPIGLGDLRTRGLVVVKLKGVYINLSEVEHRFRTTSGVALRRRWKALRHPNIF